MGPVPSFTVRSGIVTGDSHRPGDGRPGGRCLISKDVRLGEGVVVHHPNLVNLYGCEIGAGSTIGTFVEIQKGALIGTNCKISSHSFICEGVTIEDGVFVGHGVMFTNDMSPRAVTESGDLQTEEDWHLERTLVRTRASIGTNATIVTVRPSRGERRVVGSCGGVW